MAVVTDKYSAQLSADATRLQEDLAQGGKEIQKFKREGDKVLDQGHEGNWIKDTRKSFKGMAKDVAFVGFAIDHIADAFGDVDGPGKKVIEIGKEVALGWAIGGPIGAGVAGVVVLAKELATVFSGDAEQVKKINEATQELRKEQELLGATAKQRFLYEQNAKILGYQPKEADEAKKRIEERRSTFSLIPGFTPGKESGFPFEKYGFGAQVDKAFEEDKRRMGKLGDEFEKTAASKFVQSLKEQDDQLGLNAREVDIYRIKMLGLSKAWQDYAIDQANAFHLNKFQNDVKEFTRSLTQEAETFGLTSQQAKLLEFAAKGANDTMLRGTAEQIARLELLNAKAAGPNTALRVGSAAGLAAINQARRDAEVTKPDKAAIQEKANELLKQIHERLGEIKKNSEELGTVDIFKL